MSFLELVLPALAALLILLLVSYVLIPCYRSRQRYAQYMPISLPSGGMPNPIPQSWRSRLVDVLRPLPGFEAQFLQDRDRRYSGLSDEEMDPVDTDAFGAQGLADLPGNDFDGRGGGRPDARTLGGRGGGGGRARANSEEHIPRLSRDLEAGFRDDSDEEEDAETARGRGR